MKKRRHVAAALFVTLPLCASPVGESLIASPTATVAAALTSIAASSAAGTSASATIAAASASATVSAAVAATAGARLRAWAVFSGIVPVFAVSVAVFARRRGQAQLVEGLAVA